MCGSPLRGPVSRSQLRSVVAGVLVAPVVPAVVLVLAGAGSRVVMLGLVLVGFSGVVRLWCLGGIIGVVDVGLLVGVLIRIGGLGRLGRLRGLDLGCVVFRDVVVQLGGIVKIDVGSR